MTKFFISSLLFVMIVLTACAASSAATEAPPPTNTVTPTATQTPLPPTSTPTPSPTHTPTPTITPTPTSSPTPTPTPTPSLRQLTNDGCCVQPFFSANGDQVLFIDKPSEESPVGIYGIDLVDPQPTPQLVSTHIGFSNADGSIIADLDDELLRLTNETTGESWSIDTGGNWPRFSPDSSQILWTAADRTGPYDQRQNDVWLADIDGSNPQQLLSLYGGGFAGWFPDGKEMLMIGRDDPAEEDVTMFVYNLANGQRTNLVSQNRLRGIQISPGGTHIVYYLTFADTPADNGIWLVGTNGDSPRKLDMPDFGAYRWRDDDTLLYIPMRASGEESMQIWAIDAATGQATPLTNPASLPFSIANGDWDVSPDGHHLIFVNSADMNIWAINLP